MHSNSFNFLDKLIAHLRSRELIKNFSLKNKKILDFGCGSDFKTLKELYKDCEKITLVDSAGDNFEDGQITFINYQNDLNTLKEKIKKNFYDLIILSAVVEHLDSPHEIINILKNKLNYNGCIFLTAPGKKSKVILEFLGFRLKIINGDLVKEHKRYYDLEEYKKLSELVNMDIKKIYFFQFGLNTVCILR
jgi:2-polyprenyl-3-methyl-5-hydroxy-6-metoxy-1,4-benzoquinol methylase|tara:strand:- start:574 stop:1146 length:573 start_codon:yes stop_codon:yes gene_type:complete